MPESVSERLSSLSRLSKPQLCAVWKQLLRTDPPPRMRTDLMLRIVGYRMQEQEFGGLSDTSHRRLSELSNAIKADSKAAVLHRPAVKPGTRLVRQWKEQVHVVNVEEETYEYQGARYESLSEIARLITGTRWSGPLFFGLKLKQPELRRQDEHRV